VKIAEKKNFLSRVEREGYIGRINQENILETSTIGLLFVSLVIKDMMLRYQQLKLLRGHSTKAERRFLELLKEMRLPFRAKVKVAGREVDFIVGKYAIDIDGHGQDPGKNELLVREGYVPIHFHNSEVKSIDKNNIKKYFNAY
jgi:very-short-patch-repair endonuclease